MTETNKAALAPAEKAGDGSFTAHEILATAEIYLASNAAESGADQLIRELCVALRSADKLNDIQIKHMVDRFLSWKLPRDTFNPDCGISFDRKPFNTHTAHPMLHEPMGTNLFDATQADAMVRHMIDGLPPATPTPPSADVERVFNHGFDCGFDSAVGGIANPLATKKDREDGLAALIQSAAPGGGTKGGEA